MSDRLADVEQAFAANTWRVMRLALVLGWPANVGYQAGTATISGGSRGAWLDFVTALDLEVLVQVRKTLEGVLVRLQDRQNNLGPPESWHEHELTLSEEELESWLSGAEEECDERPAKAVHGLAEVVQRGL